MAWQQVGNLRGPAGPQGPAGGQGAQGPMGPAGPAGANYRGLWAAGTAYNEHDQVTRNGGAFIVPTGTAQIVAGNDPNPSGDGRTAANGWVLFAAEGAVGPEGPAGAQGPQGPAGAAGAPGAQGPKGDPGVAGPQGPQGDPGPQGIQGVQGVAGADGAQGPAGAQGIQGVRGSQWFTGHGAPPANIAGSQANDQYLDLDSGDIYTLA